jgi:hypothetical protein
MVAGGKAIGWVKKMVKGVRAGIAGGSTFC